jgi:hypothetical protein
MERLNACELKTALFCRGLRIGPGCNLEEDARFLSRTRAGLGNGLDLIIPGDLKDLWVNVPVDEDFVEDSPFLLIARSGTYWVRDGESRNEYEVTIPLPLPISGSTTHVLVARGGITLHCRA